MSIKSRIARLDDSVNELNDLFDQIGHLLYDLEDYPGMTCAYREKIGVVLSTVSMLKYKVMGSETL